MLIQDVLFKEAHAIIKAAKTLTNELDPIVDLIVESAKCNRHVILSGVGKNSAASFKAAATLSSIGIPSFELDASTVAHGDLGAVTPGSVVIGLSKSGETKELNDTFEAIGHIENTRLVGIVCAANSTLEKIVSKYGGITVVLPFDGEADALNLAPTSSSTLILAVLDAIACVASERLGFTKEDFLFRHSGGSLGRQLKRELGK